MYVHKYIAEGKTFYTFLDKPGKPEGSVNLSPGTYKGSVTGERVTQALDRINAAFKEEPKEKPKKTPKEEPKNASLPDMIRALADQVEKSEDKEQSNA